ncbi:cupin domain-containing protein [Kribbella soli]|uniref:Cupin domain-containing protein n=1 Tax=Kribbella soli TaxID=1124743 RepID=A0A4R0HQI6_9ACTN|nr:cupin domain-containing protein [Kribbella soli]TCC12280.1 cupin domain-containing protein [Kribbella soli]
MSKFMGPFAVQAGEGAKYATPTSGSVIVKADTVQTNGSLTVLELLIPPNDGPPAHTHLREDEVWYVVDGDFRFKAGDAMLRASTGGLAFGPRGVPHAFQNVGDSVGRLLVITTPAGLERFFEQSDELSRPPDPEELAAIAYATWIEFSGLPLALSDPL